MALDKKTIIEDLKKRPGMELVELDSLYDDALEDMANFTHRTKEELNKIAAGSIIKDLVAYRFNTLGVEGIAIENQGGVSTHYSSDIPSRIKGRLKVYRRLNYVREQ